VSELEELRNENIRLKDRKREEDEGWRAATTQSLADIKSEISENTRVSREGEKAMKILTGNGAPENGVILRVDRLEQRNALVWTAFVSSLAAGASLLWSYVTKGVKP